MTEKIDTQRRDALSELIRAPMARAYVASPPLHLGGGVDVLSFAAPEGGYTYVTSGLSHPRFPQRFGAARFELAIHAREPNEWAPRLLARIGPTSAGLRYHFYDTLPLADGSSRLGGLVFAPHEPRAWSVVGDQRYLLMRCVGVTLDELAACRIAGAPTVLSAIERAGIYPFTDPNRPTVPSIDTMVRSPPGFALQGHLSPAGRRGFQAVLHGVSEDVEVARDGLLPSDVPVLAVAYLQLPSWPQRSLLLHLTQDHHHPSLHHAWRHALAMPEPEDRSEGHSALAIALAGLDRDMDAYSRYLNDLPRTIERAKALRASAAN
jgi:hypothetical protein